MQPVVSVDGAKVAEQPGGAAGPGKEPGQIKWVADASGRPKQMLEEMASVDVNCDGKSVVGSGDENQLGGNKLQKTSERSAEDRSRGDGEKTQDTLDHDKQIACKKEKRRRQNREAQRRRRDRLMNQHRQKQADDEKPGRVGQDAVANSPYLIMAGNNGMELFNATSGMHLAKHDQHAAMGNGGIIPMHCPGDMNAAGCLQNSNMSMQQKQFPFGASGALGPMPGWTAYNAVMQGAQGNHPMTAAQRSDSFNLGRSSLVHNASLNGSFGWDPFTMTVGGGMPALNKQGSFGAGHVNSAQGSVNVGSILNQNSFSMPPTGIINSKAKSCQRERGVLGEGGGRQEERFIWCSASLYVLTSSFAFLRAGVFTGQNSFTFGNGINPLLKSGSFAPPDFSAFLRQDSRGTHIACEFMHTTHGRFCDKASAIL